MTKTEAKEYGKKLREEGLSWQEVAAQFAKKGFVKGDGSPYTQGGAYSIVVGQTQKNRVKKRGKAVMSHEATKQQMYDLALDLNIVDSDKIALLKLIRQI